MRDSERLMEIISNSEAGKDSFEKIVFDPETKRLKTVPIYGSNEGCIEMTPQDGTLS